MVSPQGLLSKDLHGEALPQGPTPYPFIHHFLKEKVYPFLIPSIDNLVYKFASLLTAQNALSL